MMTTLINTSYFIAKACSKKTWWCNLKIDEKQKERKGNERDQKKTLHKHKDHCNDHNDNVNISQQKAW